MTDSMKFGPEWLRNMATDTTNNQGSGGGGGSSSTSSASSTNSNNNGASSSYPLPLQLLQRQMSRSLFPEFRYGREEMLSLFNNNCNMPEILPSFKKLYIEQVQYPLALTPSTEEEVFSSVAQPPTRPQWLQRSPVAFNSAPRGRGGSVDRGRMRGKSMYHPIFPRPTPMFEDDARNLKSERGWSERNGGAGESSAVGFPDWSVSPSSSPRKDFAGHPARNLENWRRSRHDEDGIVAGGPPGGANPTSTLGSSVMTAGGSGPGGDGWRGSGSNNFGNNRWGRSTSWRDEDGGNGVGIDANAYNIPPMQRSYSTIATTERTYFSGLSKSSSLTSAAGGGGVGAGSGGDGNNKSNMSGRHHHQNSANHQWDTEDMLPEWAMENPTDSGGTFDATGAFHGSVEEDDEKRRGRESGSSSTTSNSSASNRKKSIEDGKISHRGNRKIGPKGDEKGDHRPNKDRVNLNDDDLESHEIIEQRSFRDENPQHSSSVAENLIHSSGEISSINKLETTEDHTSADNPSMNSSSPSQQQTPHTTSTPNSANTKAMMMMQQPSQKMPLTELSDRMQEVADDMVEKLIMDDDNVAQDSQKSTSTAGNSVASAAAVAAGKVAMNANIIPSGVGMSNAAKVAAMYKNQAPANKPIFFPVVDPMMHAAVAAGMGSGGLPPGTRMLPPPITKPNNELWYYRDPQSKVQGPFTAMEMIEWYRAGYFDENLYVRRMCDNRFAALGDLIKMCGQMPFQSSHLIPPLQSTDMPSMANPIPIMPLPSHDPGHQIKDAPLVGIVNGPNIASGDLKASVTATADALSAAVKNMMNPVDMSHMLNAHFQMLQEQYIRHQEMLILSEFSTKETFNRLTPSEKAAVVRQRVHMIGLPEYLTSLTGLSNSLASLNPAAGHQLYEVIAECSKKDTYGMSPLEAQLQQFQQQHLHHQQQQQAQQQQVQHQQAQQHQQVQQQSQNPYLEQDDFLQQQQQQQVSQQSGMYQNVPYRSSYNTIDGTGSSGPVDEQINAEIINELNLRMMLRQGRLRTGREQPPLPPPLAPTPNDYGAELLARAGPQVLAAAVVNMMPQWPPHMLPHGQMPQQPPQQQAASQQNIQPQQVTGNQWPIIGGSAPVPQLQAVINKPPTSMWAAAEASAAQLIMQQQQQSQSSQQQQVDIMHAKVENNFIPVTLPAPQQQQLQHRHQATNSNSIGKTKEESSVEENANAINDNVSALAPSNSITPPGTALTKAAYVNNSNTTNNKNKIDKLKPTEDMQTLIHINTKQQTSASPISSIGNTNANANNSNKRNVKQKSNEKPIDSSKNKVQQQAQLVAGSTEEDRRKEAAEEKRKQKEEKKRQQQEEEKKRLQSAEEEKRRQASEEKERQKEIHAHRRKAMLGGNGGGFSGLGSNSNLAINGKPTISGPGNSAMTKQERMQTSIAPWSTNAQAAIPSAPGPSLAEIQKAERRERRADQQRHLELLEKQMRIAAAAAEATDNVLKWNPAPVAVKSLAEIQAEEAKRLATEHATNAELQRRKDQEQANSAAANSLPSNPFAMIWSGSKVWGTTNSTSGFWEEPVKFPTAAAAISSSAPTTASVVAKTIGQSSGGNTKQSAAVSSASGGNTSSSAIAAAGANRNLSKSQTVSNMVSSSNWTSVHASGNSSQAKSNQQNSFVKQQQGGNKEKKGVKNNAGPSGSTNGSSANSASATNVANNHINKNDDYRNEFTGWCMKSLNNMSPKVDVPTFVSFLQDLESPYEVKDYIRMYLGESKEYTEFAKQFLERRSKYKNLQRAQNAHIDDMCKPAPAINPSGNDSFDNKGKQKKVKKSKMTKLDARILGFSVTAAEGRINVGDRDYVDAS